MNWLHSPILAMDTETTGTNVESDRIVTIAIGRSTGPGDWNLIEESLVNPGVTIQADATKVHGITDEDAAKGSPPRDVLESVHEILTQAAERRMPIVGFNLVYDLTLIDRELRRHCNLIVPDDLIVIDVLVLFRRFDFSTGRRTLEQLAYRNGITFPAHNAAADALASLRLLHILAGENDLLPLVHPSDLHAKQAAWYEAQTLAAHHRRLGNGHVEPAPNTSWPLIPMEVAA